MTRAKDITVIGAGVSGLSTSLLLQVLGFRVTLISASHPFSSGPDSLFVSKYPSASVIPHSFEAPDKARLFENSQIFFKQLLLGEVAGLSSHPHFEAFHESTEPFWYIKHMDRFSVLDPHDLPFEWPGEIDLHSAWKFHCYFADWAVYYPALLQAFEHTGGKLVIKKISPEDLSDLSAELIINCSELGSAAIFPGRFSYSKLQAGHLLYLPEPDAEFDPAKVISYNITPPASIHGLESQVPMDFYSYRRKDGWILGGSRIPATLHAGSGIHSEYPEMLSAEAFPAPIFELNRDIIRSYYGVDIGDLAAPEPRMSYRMVYAGPDGLLLEEDKIEGKRVIHNVGHGGAGVTMSWGCAYKIASMIKASIPTAAEISKEIASSF